MSETLDILTGNQNSCYVHASIFAPQRGCMPVSQVSPYHGSLHASQKWLQKIGGSSRIVWNATWKSCVWTGEPPNSECLPHHHPFVHRNASTCVRGYLIATCVYSFSQVSGTFAPTPQRTKVQKVTYRT